MKKRLIAVIVAVTIVLGSLLAFLIVNLVKKSNPPELSALRPRIEALVESAREVNEIFFGAGLATYPRVYTPTLYDVALIYDEAQGAYREASAQESDDVETLYYHVVEDETLGTLIAYRYCLIVAVEGEDGKTKYAYVDVQSGGNLEAKDLAGKRYARRTEEPLAGETPLCQRESEGVTYYYYTVEYEEKEPEFLYTAEDLEFYDYVRLDGDYLTVESIKARAEQVYSSSYLSSIYESMFTGVTVSGSNSGTLYARYYEHQKEDGTILLMKRNTETGFDTDRVFDYDTMRMLSTSNAKYVSIEVETYLRADPAKRVTVTLSLALENGQWMLDSPTY